MADVEPLIRAKPGKLALDPRCVLRSFSADKKSRSAGYGRRHRLHLVVEVHEVVHAVACKSCSANSWAPGLRASPVARGHRLSRDRGFLGCFVDGHVVALNVQSNGCNTVSEKLSGQRVCTFFKFGLSVTINTKLGGDASMGHTFFSNASFL